MTKEKTNEKSANSSTTPPTSQTAGLPATDAPPVENHSTEGGSEKSSETWWKDLLQVLFRDRDLAWTVIGLSGLSFSGVLPLLVYSFSSSDGFAVFGISFMVAAASMGAGTLLGFLFGIPRPVVEGEPASSAAANTRVRTSSNSRAEVVRGQQVNTNLVQVSDWLTKILLGIGLSQLHTFPGRLGSIGTALSAGFENPEGGRALVVATIVFFVSTGFLNGYLLTRLFLAPAFSRVDDVYDMVETQVKTQIETQVKKLAAGEGLM